MENKNITENISKNNNGIYEKICHLFEMELPELESENVVQGIKELCVKKLCLVVGIKCACNFRNPYFNFFGCVMGQAVCNKLSLRYTIAPAGLRLVKYDGINFILRAEQYLNNPDIEEAFIDIFDLTDDHKNIIALIDWEQM